MKLWDEHFKWENNQVIWKKTGRKAGTLTKKSNHVKVRLNKKEISLAKVAYYLQTGTVPKTVFKVDPANPWNFNINNLATERPPSKLPGILAKKYNRPLGTVEAEFSRGYCVWTPPIKIPKYIYSCWSNIKSRCYNPKSPNYVNYGGRGIQMCEIFKESVYAFYLSVGDRETSDLSIDRIDNDGDYVPGNLRWATKKEQQNNRRVCANTGH